MHIFYDYFSFHCVFDSNTRIRHLNLLHLWADQKSLVILEVGSLNSLQTQRTEAFPLIIYGYIKFQLEKKHHSHQISWIPIVHIHFHVSMRPGDAPSTPRGNSLSAKWHGHKKSHSTGVMATSEIPPQMANFQTFHRAAFYLFMAANTTHFAHCYFVLNFSLSAQKQHILVFRNTPNCSSVHLSLVHI